MAVLRTLIVDDEPLARRGLRMLLDKEPDVEVVAACSSGPEAVAHIRAEAPDLVLLDIQMPEMDGFGVIEAVGVDRMPVTIFVTAYDQYALQAFDAHALDYVLKPIDAARFREALRRARAHLQLRKIGALQNQMQALLEQMRSGQSSESEPSYLERLVVKEAGRIFFLRTDEFDWLETAGNYVKLHVGKETHLIRESLSGLEERLDPDRFLRIRRSTMVNIERIKELQPLFNGEYVFLLHDGTRLTSSRRYRSNLDRLLGDTPR